MHDTLSISPIGLSNVIEGQFSIQLALEHPEGLVGLTDFSHAIALWWAHEADSEEQRKRTTITAPYTANNSDFGVFATRSEARPNPVGMTVFSIASVDAPAGRVISHYFDMLPNTPIMDIKPYFAASDRVMEAQIPDHFSQWPTSLEKSATFDWEKEFRHELPQS
ncbi:MAG: TrmO family methyltransferase [Pseudomonadota bacterium]